MTDTSAVAAQRRHDLSELATKKVFRRLIPFLLLMYVIAFLDRSNVSFAQTGVRGRLRHQRRRRTPSAPACSSSATPSSRCPATSCCTRSARAGGWPGSW